MCGIAGVINVSGVNPDNIQDMVDIIRYRGRDETGVKKLSDNIIIGHARLAVVDLVHGGQPMASDDDTVWVTFNGEIYNYVELREELKAKGYVFKSQSDTEILINLWREYGEKMVSRLIGMFAFFIWDTKSNSGILARDRQGIKPCFITKYRGGIAFCSEIKGLFTLPEMCKEINPSGLKNVFSFNYCPPPQTCFNGVMHLEAGTYLLFDGKNEPIKKRYWQWPFAEEKRTPSFEEFEELLDDAVRIQMRFDVGAGMYLSGGVDSSIIAYHLKKQWKFPRLDATGLNFADQGYSEYKYSQEVAGLLDIDLHEALITPEMLPDIAPQIVYHAEQPHGDFSFFLFYLLSQRASQQDKIVMFSGDGPDEAMGGQGVHHKHDGFALNDYLKNICYMDADVRKKVLNTDFDNTTLDIEQSFAELTAPYKNLSLAEQIVAYECTSLMAGNNLVKGERMGAKWSTEIRAPMMDHRISELFVRLPEEQKFCGGIGKYYLKKYSATKLPHDLIFKKKTMPTVPIGEWIKISLYDWAYDTLSRCDGVFINKKAALALLAEHKSGQYNHTRPLRTMLMTQMWLDNFVNIDFCKKR
jgi:asparagine synthase (glutamine-hydrolysing)